MTDVRLAGCSPAPLGHYLKALGILRLVAEQADPAAKGWWDGDAFVLRSALDEQGLVRFFADDVAPTPIVGPWSGGCGFFPGDNTSGIGPIEASALPRLASYRATIHAARRVLAREGIAEKPDRDQKGRLIEALRAELPDAAIQWVDSALALTAEGPKFPPLLGTGGNDGRLDFTNNLMQRWVGLLIDPPPAADGWLRASLFGEAAADLERGSAIGQFHPAAAGGANLSAGFERDSLVNPWDFVLMLEGALLFASAVTRRLEDSRPGALVYPFTVRSAGSGYASAAPADEGASRDEIWLPEWRRPTALDELRTLFSEGRASVRSGDRRRPANSAVDFARAIQELGVQRGVDAFTRFGFQQRNGLSYLAVPLGRWRVRRNPDVDLLAPLDRWMQRFRSAATDRLAPASIRRALSRLDDAVLALCAAGEPPNVQRVLVALGAAEAALARSMRFTEGKGLGPVRGLTPDWIDRADDRSVEWRLAVALAGAGLRDFLVPVRDGAWAANDDGRTVWGEGSLVDNLIAVARRVALDGTREIARAEPHLLVDLGDVGAFVDGAVDDSQIVELLRGAAAIDWRHAGVRALRGARSCHPPYAYAACALVGGGRIPARDRDIELPAAPAVLARLVAGDATGAVDAAHRRLHGSGVALRAGLDARVAEDPRRAKRIAAALLFPLSASARRELCADVVRSETDTQESR